jgi:flagellar motility protein MotE (MotC chaperone)
VAKHEAYFFNHVLFMIETGSGFSPVKRSLSPRQSATDRLGCCFFLSPKKTTNTSTKSKGKDRNGGEFHDMNLDEELDDLWDTRNLYAVIKDQQKKLKKTLKEQEKVSREATKLVRQSKGASARMRLNTDELLSDLDEDELSTQFH